MQLPRKLVCTLFIVQTFILARAAQLEGVDIHGSASATSSYSSNWDFGGSNKDTLALVQTDLILNGVHRFDSGLRAGAQIYAYKYSNYRDITLDWAGIDYAFNQQFGVRLGRNKIMLGLYNEMLDLDSARVFANLPLSFYPRTLRPIANSADGVTAYGTIDLGKPGSVELEGFFGRKDNVAGDTPILRSFTSGGVVVVDHWKFGAVAGASAIWNTPVEGLRFAYTYSHYYDSDVPGYLAKRAAITNPDQQALPGMIDALYGQGAWDSSGLFAGTPADLTGVQVSMRTISAEYTKGSWSFAAEYQMFDIFGGTRTIPAFVRLGQPLSSPFEAYYRNGYVQASYQVNKQFGVGAYYCLEAVNHHLGYTGGPSDYQKDYAAAVSYAPTKWLTLKVEAHQLNGLSRVNSDGSHNVVLPTSRQNWNLYVFQTVVSF